MSVSDAESAVDAPEPSDADKKELQLDVKVDVTGSCGRHITVTVSEDDVKRYMDDAFSGLMPKASVPGFRAGRAPRRLVESRFKDDVRDQVKGSLLMDSMTQVTTTESFAAISEPVFDFDAVELESDGEFTFEFDIEVRPEFDLPDWKGLTVERPVKEFEREDIDAQLRRVLAGSAKMTPHDGPAEANDAVMLQVAFKHEGKVVSECTEDFKVVSTISFPDAVVSGFDTMIIGAKQGDKRTGKATVSHEATNESLRGVELDVEVEVLDVKRPSIPELDESMLSELGDFESEGDLRDAIKKNLEHRLAYQQQQQIRKQITALLTESAEWDLPQDLLKRQAARELERAKLELRSARYSEEEIRAYENELRQNSLESTKRALKEHFILERIAEDEGIEDEPGDYDLEIQLLAAQNGDSPRRVRARLEKQGMMDALRNQIIERKVIAKIMSAAEFKDVPLPAEENQVFGVDHVVTGEKDSAIPVAKHGGGDPEQLREKADRT